MLSQSFRHERYLLHSAVKSVQAEPSSVPQTNSTSEAVPSVEPNFSMSTLSDCNEAVDPCLLVDIFLDLTLA